ncbi:IclR family transcriptional regulator [Paraburkholderia fungorum]|uniref:IclR family transcriptional regulator n=1 Tax=Paraburkholderia fungorum TaxID=134537 RepID=UPI0038BA042D
MVNKEPPTASVGAIEKACRVLKALTDGRNTRLVDIAGYCGLDKATTMRVLDTLIREQLVERDPQTRRYRLGPEVARLAKGVSEPVDWRELARPSLMRLSGAFEDTTIMSVLSSLEMVCVDLQMGSYPIRANYQDIGSRRTLGVGSSGLAVLATLPQEECDVVLAQIAPRLSRYPMLTQPFLVNAIEVTRAKGYAVLIDAVVPRMGGIAVAIRAPSGDALASLSMAALSERVLERETQLAAAMLAEAAKIEGTLARAAAANA